VVSDSILDWIDPDDLPRVAGAESDYYQGLPVPYYAKNAPIDDTTELLLVRGIWDHPEIYWGGSASNHPPAVFQHKLGLGHTPGQTPDYPFGLKDIFTATSSGRVNMNTADANVVAVLTGDPSSADAIIKAREGPDEIDGNDDDTPYPSMNDLAKAGIIGPALQQISGIGNFRSMVFKVTVTVHVGVLPTREYIAILYRLSPMDVRVVSFYWH